MKQTNYIINQEKCTVKEIPSREDSLDRMMAFGTDFADNESNFDEAVLRKVMLEQALEKLNDEERYLITQLFYFGRTERDLAKELKIPQRTLHDYKRRILCKLHEFLKRAIFFKKIPLKPPLPTANIMKGQILSPLSSLKIE